MHNPNTNLTERAVLLGRCSLFKPLNQPELEALASIAVPHHFDNDQTLFFQDDKARGFHVIATGSLKICRIGLDGREQVLQIMEAGQICGEVPVFAGQNYPASAIAVGALSTLYLSRENFLDLGKKHPEILMEMLGVLSQRLRLFVDLIDALSLKEVSARLAQHLLDLRPTPQASVVRIDTTKAMLASQIGTIAETLSRTLNKMQRHGILAVQGSEVTILDPDRLHALATGEKL